jgi:hypothetical protein
MTGGVDEIEDVGLAVAGSVIEPHRARLDSDAAFALEIHGIKELCLEFAFADGTGTFEQAVGEGRLTVIDVGDNRKIADQFR